MTAHALRSAAELRRRHQEARVRVDRAEHELEQVRQLAARWRREVGELAEQLAALSGPMQFVRGLFGGGRRRAEISSLLEEARHKHDEADARVPALERAWESARRAAAELEHAPVAFAELLAERERELRAQGGDLAERLERSAERVVALDEECDLLLRVVQAGRDAEGELLVARQSVQLARAAAHADVLGGGIGTGKVPALRDTERHLLAAGRHLERMGREMEERAAVVQRITFPDGRRLGDVLFDRLPSDLFVLRRIKQAADDIAATIEQLRGALWAAEAEQKRLDELAQAANEERAAWIVEAD